MPYKPPRTLIEKLAVKFGLVPDTDGPDTTHAVHTTGRLSRFPDESRWNDLVEYDPREWPRRASARHYRLVPTTCFNCESACGLLAYVDKQNNTIRKLEGNPVHPGSRGKNCAKGPATINQITDPDRILAPMKRVGPRGAGQWKEVSWDEALSDIGGRIRRAIQEERRDEIIYHVGRPGAEGFIDRVLRAWGVDGHNSHTNICSSGARFGYAIWSGYDRPSPDYANARFILAMNAHLESGHYFNPHAQRISEGLKRGARMAVVDPRLSNTASMASIWLPTRPGTEAALLLAFARIILEEGLYDRGFIERWTNWRAYMAHIRTPESGDTLSFDNFLLELRRLYAAFTPEYAEAECGVSRNQVVEVARLIGEAGSRFCSHTWRGAASAHEGGWQVARCLFFLHVLTGSVGTEGGCLPSAWNKYKANLINVPPPQKHWNELNWPREFPLAHYEMSFLLPHFLKTGRGRIDTYFTRVFNPVWTYPDGFSWIEVLRDEDKIGCHVALTPTWNETALYADYVLPMGHGPERHDLNTYETHSATWIAFRQPVLRAAALAEGRTVRDTRDVNPGAVWEEDEFWIALTWAIDPDGSLGIRRYFESQRAPGEILGVDEYYAHIFDRVPGLPEKAAAAGLSPLDYMRKFGAHQVKAKTYLRHERQLSDTDLEDAAIDFETGIVSKEGHAIGICLDVAHRAAERAYARGTMPAAAAAPQNQPVPSAAGGPASDHQSASTADPKAGQVDSTDESSAPAAGPMASLMNPHSPVAYQARSLGAPASKTTSDEIPAAIDDAAGGTVFEGFATPSRLLEFFSPTMIEWGWPEHALPGYIPSHVYLDEFAGDQQTGASDRSTDPAAADAKSPNRQITRSPDHFVLLPTFRLPTLIHTRSGSAKWLNEISQQNPVWIHTSDARRMGVKTGDLVRVSTDIGHFVDRCWVTEAIRPGVIACSHHLGRWRRRNDPPNSRWSANTVAIEEAGNGVWKMRTLDGPAPFESADPDSRRLWWREGGVPQNLTFPVHPDPISGMHCWHQRVRVEPAAPSDRSGDVLVDTARSMQVYENWMKKARWPVGPGNLRRPLWLNRPLRPVDAAFRLPE